jgi:2',3'-cyclic-nucleotide 2'-phosphodiesterase (5'-nucleotidase family)
MSSALSFLSLLPLALACGDDGGSCYGASDRDVVLTRNVRRTQPEAQNATSGPRGPLQWGQVNFLHTTDTHGWLEGHIKEKNYGADWGDYVSFVKGMRAKASKLGVDLLLVDTGDLHDGAGLSDATSPNGLISNPIFENVDYDLLTIGNHELYVTEIAYETFSQFAKVYGDKYITSNVQIMNPTTKEFEYIGSQYRYFTTEHGVRIMAFGVLFDFTGNSNVSKVIKAADLVKEQWFLSAVNYKEPIDMFVLIGHNPIRANASTCTLDTVYAAIREAKPDTPIQMFGGHTHIRDFAVYDNKATGLESGRYCETLGWLSISGLKHFKGCSNPEGVPNPTTKAVAPVQTGNATLPQSKSPSTLRYSRRYLDWNRLTFAYHAEGSQDYKAFDSQGGKAVTAEISAERKQLNLSQVYGCAPATYCQFCKPFGTEGNLFKLLGEALSTVVVNETRKDTPRIIIINTGSVRFDLAQGPFTYDDSFIVSPFTDAFQFLADVPYQYASVSEFYLCFMRTQICPPLQRLNYILW